MGVGYLQLGKNGFKLCLDSKDVLDNLNVNGTLRRAVKDSESVIGVRDMVKLVSFEGKWDKLRMESINDIEVRDLLRNVKNRKGKYVYQNISVSTQRLNGDPLYAMQLFAYSEKLSNLVNEINPTFSSLGFGSMQSAPPLALKYKSYAAIYLPIIVEVLPKKLFREAVSNLSRRIKDSPTVNYKAASGDVKIDLTKILAKARAILEKNSMLAVIRDGTHRAYLSTMQNALNGGNAATPTNIIILGNSSGSAHSVPIKMSDVVVVREKPKSNKDRYMGLVQREMEYFKGVGVDG